jgi:nucleoside-diphosphate-sugar epimerase
MSDRILVLGAAGRLGYAAAQAFHHAGWTVVSLVRRGASERAVAGTEIVEADALDRAAVVEAARDADVVLHALNPPYTDWPRFALPLAYAAIEAAETAGATLMFPGNVYNFGSGMPEVLDAETPMRPTSRKGRLRVEIEQRMREASERGVRTIILRAGDFYGGVRGSWFDLVLTRDLGRRRIIYPGPVDVVHPWAYVPDVAATMVRLAEVRATLPAFASFGFPGHAVTGAEMGGAIAAALRERFQVKRMEWWLIKTFGRLSALGRELAEIEYLWRTPHRISGETLATAIGEVPHTPFAEAVAASLRELAYRLE